MPHNLTSINWDSFTMFNRDARGIRFKFEDLCRQLFVNEFLASNTDFRCLHSNPNNPGLETDPVYCERDKRWIGFQAKYFDGNPGYQQIYDSAQKIVSNYKGKVEHVYLFSNKELSYTHSSKLRDTRNLLNDNGIILELVTDRAVLDLVRKYPYLGLYYFGQHSITHNWFLKNASYRYDNLGNRYNNKFNVDTTTSRKLSLFCIDKTALSYINDKKQIVLKEIAALRNKYDYQNYSGYFRKLNQCILSLPDVDFDTIRDSFAWKDKAESAVSLELKQFVKEEQQLMDEKKEDQSDDRQEIQHQETDRRRKAEILSSLIQLPSSVEISKEEQRLIERDVLIITGKAGCGKSHLLANETSVLLNESVQLAAEDDCNYREALLILGGNLLSNGPISRQIMNSRELDYSFDDLIDILEAIGEREQRIIPIFIDALNETWIKGLWKTGLNSIIDKINESPMVKLALSFRTEYENLILPDSVKKRIQDGKIVKTVHHGFEDVGIDAIKQFLDHYNIPFTPSEYFQSELTNPLFLTLYCKTYNGDEVDLPTLYERVINQVNQNLYSSDIGKALENNGYTEGTDVLRPFIRELTSYFVNHHQKWIAEDELEKFSFWNSHRLAAPPYISQLGKEQFLYDTAYDNKTMYFFAYDQMNDYYCAKAMMDQCVEEADKKYQESLIHAGIGCQVQGSGNRNLKQADYEKQAVRDYLIHNLLNIKDGEIKNYGQEDIFVNVCALYAERFHEECIDIIKNLKKEDENGAYISDGSEIFSRYLSSFAWRKADTIKDETFYKLLQEYPFTVGDIDELWQMFIGNSVKMHHPLNADSLHRLLYGMKLADRDYLWTIHINHLMADESDRLSQMISMYVRGEKLEFRHDDQIRLFLVLLGWLLTSSDRRLRDNTSKAMIEILKEHFELCQVLLKKFEGVNDPYVLSRLYGIIFGACCKREGSWHKTAEDKEIYRSLAEYVYETVFNQEMIYPDILLRDYARSIIERFLYENPDYLSVQHVIDQKKISPPYHSEPISDVGDQDDNHHNNGNGMYYLMYSMNFEGMGMYGDFGRYIFQSALHDFDVDDKKIHNYTIYFILHDLGYKSDMFSNYDKEVNRYTYSRSEAIKTERIGKKYQWIAMYNILARVSDHCKMIDRYTWPEPREILYQGTWEPYVRDFEPTLNQNFLDCPDAPYFTAISDFLEAAIKENTDKGINSHSDYKSQTAWLSEEGAFYKNLPRILVLHDASGTEWISLTRYCDTGLKNMKDNELYIWSWSRALFVTKKQYDLLLKCFEKGVQIANSDSSAMHESHSVFNREYPWAPSCTDFEEDAWHELNIDTGETITEAKKVIDQETVKYDHDGLPEVPFREKECPIESEVKIGRVLIADTDLVWEAEYDASMDNTLSLKVPCGKMIQELGLRQ